MVNKDLNKALQDYINCITDSKELEDNEKVEKAYTSLCELAKGNGITSEDIGRLIYQVQLNAMLGKELMKYGYKLELQDFTNENGEKGYSARLVRG